MKPQRICCCSPRLGTPMNSCAGSRHASSLQRANYVSFEVRSHDARLRYSYSLHLTEQQAASATVPLCSVRCKSSRTSSYYRTSSRSAVQSLILLHGSACATTRGRGWTAVSPGWSIAPKYRSAPGSAGICTVHSHRSTTFFTQGIRHTGRRGRPGAIHTITRGILYTSLVIV